MSEATINPVSVPHDYSRGLEIFGRVANSFGIEVSFDQQEEWRLMLRACRVLDDVLDCDDPLAERKARYYDLILNIFGHDDSKELSTDELHPEFCALSDGYRTWSEDKESRVRGALEAIEGIADEKRREVSARKLGLIAIKEGYETSKLFSLDPSSDATIAVTRFNEWLNVLLCFGVVVDTCVDLQEDYDNNLTLVTPTFSNRMQVASAATRFLPPLVRLTPSGAVMSLASAAKAVIDDTRKDSLRCRADS